MSRTAASTPLSVRSRAVVAVLAVVATVAGVLSAQTWAAAAAYAAAFPSAGLTLTTVNSTSRPPDQNVSTWGSVCGDDDLGSLRPVQSVTLGASDETIGEVDDLSWHCEYPAGAPVAPSLGALDQRLVETAPVGASLGTAACDGSTPVLVGLDIRYRQGEDTPNGYPGDPLVDVAPVCGALGTDGRTFAATVGGYVRNTLGYSGEESLRCAAGSFVVGVQGYAPSDGDPNGQVYAPGLWCDAPSFDPALVDANTPITDPTGRQALGSASDGGDPAQAACGRGVLATGIVVTRLQTESQGGQIGTVGVDCSALTSGTDPTSLSEARVTDTASLAPTYTDPERTSCAVGSAVTGVVGDVDDAGAVTGIQVSCQPVGPDGTPQGDEPSAGSPQVGPGGGIRTAAYCAGGFVTGLSISPYTNDYAPTSGRIQLLCSAVTLAATAAPLPSNSTWNTATVVAPNSTTQQALTGDGGSLWFKVPTQPGSRLSVQLGNLPTDDDLAVFGDIGNAFIGLSDTAGLTRLSAQLSGTQFAPTTYSPTTYSPTTYSPTTYSPTTYSPTTYSPTTYSPTTYSPTTYSPTTYSPSIDPASYLRPSAFENPAALAGAYSAAQTTTLLGLSTRRGLTPENYSGNTWSRTGFTYIQVSNVGGGSPQPVTLTVTTAGGPCDVTLDTYSSLPTLLGVADSARTVVVTDRSRFGRAPAADVTALRSAIGSFAGAAANGGRLATVGPVAVVDLADSPQVQALQAQADAHPDCAYAKNLVADATRQIVNSYRGPATRLAYVVLAGGDDVVPFVRYADKAVVAPESGFEPPVGSDTASEASLRGDHVLGQDAYGAAYDLTLNGFPMPVPDVAVGRLVETPAEIATTLTSYVGTGGAAIRPSSTLSTGYDFLAAGADRIAGSFAAGTQGGRHDTLITDQGVDRTKTTVNGVPSRSTTWTATDLRTSLLGTRHDVVYLAGHFSGSAALAADFTSVVTASEVGTAPANTFKGTLVFSAGCHSGYNVVDHDGVPGVTDTLDWAQAFARAGATFVAGTGYQYGDTDFVKYSNQLYVDYAATLLRGSGAVPVGTAMVSAKRDYLAAQAALDGVDQKSLLQATVFGLPMQGVDFPTGRTPAPVAPTAVPTVPLTGQPAQTLGLSRYDTTVVPDIVEQSKTLTSTDGSSVRATWFTGPNGQVEVSPAKPALPVVSANATAPVGTVLRGVGFRSGTYYDTPGVTPLTGAPATETNTVHVPFSSSTFYPNATATPNYFDALPGGNGATTLQVTPVQYRSDGANPPTTTQRVYSDLGYSLYYSGNVATYGGNQPALAAAPTFSGVTATASDDGTSVEVSTHVLGDPSAGIQNAWVTWTVPQPGQFSSWRSVDLTQDTSDSTLWRGTIALGPSESPGDVQFMVQAVNGVGVVGLDDNDGAYYRVAPGNGQPATPDPTSLTFSGPASGVPAGGTVAVQAALRTGGGTLAGQPVRFSGGGSTVLATTDSGGVARAQLPLPAATGPVTVTADYDGGMFYAASTAVGTVQATQRPSAVALTAGTTGWTVRVTDTGGARAVGVPGRLAFVVAKGTGGVVLAVRPVTLDATGSGLFPASALPAGVTSLTALFASPSVPLIGGGSLDQSDRLYLPAVSPSVTLTVSSLGLAVAPSTVTAGQKAVVTGTAKYGSFPVPVKPGSGLTLTAPSGVTCDVVTGCSATRAGTYTLSGSYLGKTATATLTVVAGPAAAIAATGGASQTANPGATFGAPLQATVTDAYGNGVRGAPVTFTLPAPDSSGTGGATFSGGARTATVTTGTDGVAKSPSVVAGSQIGALVATASSPGTGNAATYQLTIASTAKAKADLSITMSLPATARPGATVTATVTVRNAGPDTASAVLVPVATLTSGSRITAVSGGRVVTPGIGVRGFSAIASGKTATFTVTVVTSPSARQTIMLGGVLAGTSDPKLSNNLTAAAVRTG